MWGSKMTGFFIILASFMWTMSTAQQQSLTDILYRHRDLSEFLSLVRASPFLNASLPWRQGTLFAPTDDAIRAYRNAGGRIDNHTLLYHFANVAKRTRDLEDILSTELPGNTPIWITRNPRSESEIYLNDAMIDRDRRDFHIKNALGMDQVLHVIDRVLDPTVPDSGDGSLLNPNAWKFLESSSSYNITGTHRITEFARKIASLGKSKVFKDTGRHTFFIPVDDAFNRIQIGTVDEKVIYSHIIPRHVIFLRPAEHHLKTEFETIAQAEFDPVKVHIDKSESGDKYIVRSVTRFPSKSHLQGVVQTDVVKGNIPVRNGVVHLINKPLAVIDSTVYQTLANEKENGPTYEFFKLFNDFASLDLKDAVQRPQGGRGITVFVPSNEALRSPTLDQAKSNAEEINEILKLHIVMQTIRSDNILEASERSPFQVETMAHKKQLFFNSNMLDGRKQYYVEGGGVNATITQPDIGATNGVIHMINRILGYADQSIFSKLQTDPMLQKTFELTSQDDFNLKFTDPKMRFTLFAPSNLAWEKIYRTAPSEYKKLQMGGFGYHVARIMERHMVVGRALKIEQLHELSASTSYQSFPIQAVHGILRVENQTDIANRYHNKDYYSRIGPYERVPSPYDYSVIWMNERADVVRPNIVCTNGIIHIIDTVLMQPDDVTVAYVSSMNSAPTSSSGSSQLFLVTVIISFSLLLRRPL